MNLRTLGLLLLLLLLGPARVGAAPPGEAPGAAAPGDSPSPAAPAEARPPLDLTLPQAVQRALDTNVRVQVSAERIREAEGRVTEVASALLPRLDFSLHQANRTVNLAAQGFVSGLLPIPKLVGPFYNFDTRLALVHRLFDATRGPRLEAARLSEQERALEHEFARQTVTALASLAYVAAVSADRALESARSDLELSRRLVELARHQRDLGMASGVDVTRAETRMAQQQLRLATAEERSRRTRVELLRLAGLPLDTPLVLLDSLREPSPEPPVDVAAMVREAQGRRLDLQVARKEVEVLGGLVQAAEGEDMPSLDLEADFGLSGNTPGANVYGTRNVMLQLSLPVFDGGASEGRQDQLESRRRQAERQAADLADQVDEDVRLSLLALGTASVQVDAARQELALAEKELQMTAHRFEAGLADNLEVLSSQTSVAEARFALVAALARFNESQVQLASALGVPERILELYGREAGPQNTPGGTRP